MKTSRLCRKRLPGQDSMHVGLQRVLCRDGSCFPHEEDTLDESQFWEIVAQAGKGAGGDCSVQAEKLTRQLLALPKEEIPAFQGLFDRFSDKAYRWDLWGAAYVLNGGCSDDGFDYFRWWLIAQGEQTYNAVLSDPDSLGQYAGDDGEAECEDIGYAMTEAYEEKSGGPLTPKGPHATEPAGEPWREEDLDRLFPRLTRLAEERFGSGL